MNFLFWCILLLISGALGCRHEPNHSVTIRVVSHTVPKGDQPYITGNLEVFENWKPDAVALEQRADTVWERTFALKRGTNVMFTITRGSWRTQVLDARGTQYNPVQSLHVTNDTTIVLKLTRWMDRDGGSTALRRTTLF